VWGDVADSQSTRDLNSRSCWNWNIEAVKQHLAAGTDVNAKDNYKSTPLHLRLVKAMEHLNILQRYHDFSLL
jgi:ankyrin repeat protein